MTHRRSFVALAFFVLAIPGALRAQWSADPSVNTVVYDLAAHQRDPVLLADGSGGAFIAWRDTRSGATVYAQHINSYGRRTWNPDGILVSAADFDDKDQLSMISDGAGGIIVVWRERPFDYQLYAQRLDGLGQVQWSPGGVTLTGESPDQRSPQIAPDGNHGAIVTWQKLVSGTFDVFVQRVDASGNLQWGWNGINICTAAADQVKPIIVASPRGGAVVAWTDYRLASNAPKIFAQLVDGNGSESWTANGIRLSDALRNQENPRMVLRVDPAVPDTSVIVVWQNRTFLETSPGFGIFDWDIFGQRIGLDGSRHWGAFGDTMISNNQEFDQGGPNIAAIGPSTFAVVWDDRRTTNLGEPYAQSFDKAGALLWNPAGKLVDAQTYAAGSLEFNAWPIVPDGVGNIIVAFHEYDIEGPYPDIYAQKLSGIDGSRMWGSGRAVGNAPYYQQYPQMVSDGGGGAILTWTDSRDLSDVDLYIQRINSDGSLPSDTISGTVFVDVDITDGLGYQAATDTALEGWQVILLTSGGSPLDTAVTDTNGVYQFPNLGFGSYTVRQIPQSTHEQSFPELGGDHTVAFGSPGRNAVRDFGNSIIKPAVTSGDWNAGANWTGGTAPDPNDIAVIPSGIAMTVSDLTIDTVLAVVVRSGGSLTFTDLADILKISAFLIVEPGATLTFPASVPSAIICLGSFIDAGTFNSGQSTFYFLGDRRKYISVNGVPGGGAAPATIPSRFRAMAPASMPSTLDSFYDVVISGDSTSSLSNIPVANSIDLSSSFRLRPEDTLAIANDDPASLSGSGLVAEGTISRAIDPATLLPYRFESERTSVQFAASGTRPSSLAMTPYPDSVQSTAGLCVDTATSTVDTLQNVVTATGVNKFSRWAFSRVRRPTGGDPPPPVRRYYALSASGGIGFNATVSFRYDQGEIPPSIPEEDIGILRLETCGGPEFFVSNSFVSFDTVTVGSSATDSLDIENTGGSPLVISSASSDNPEFGVSLSSDTVPGFGSVRVHVTFTPALAGNRSGTISFHHNAPGSPHAVVATGTGGGPNFALSAPALDFGSVRVGDDSVRNVTVSNSGTAPLTVSAAAAGDPQFSILPAGAVVPPGGSQPFSVTFLAASTGAAAAAAVFTHDASGSPDTVLLSATGVAPSYAALPDPLHFGDVIVGLAKTDTVTVSNTGGAALTVSGAATSGGPYSVTPSSATVLPGGSWKFAVTFAPASAGMANGLLVIAHDAAGSPDTVGLDGTGVVSSFAVLPSGLDYDTVAPGQPKTDSLVVTNSGGAPLVISSAAGSPASFAVSPASATVPPFGSQKFYVTFTPAAAGPVSGNVTFTHNAPGSPSAVPVSGFGGVGAFSVDPPLMAFIGVVVGSSATDSLTVANTGNGTLVIASVSTTSPEFTAGPSAATLGLGDSARFGVTFAPASSGARQAFFVLVHNGASSPDTVELNGFAVDPPSPQPTTTAWHLLSVPVAIAPTAVQDLFPSATTSGFAYSAGGYSPTDTLVNGRGYWVKISGPDTTALSGLPILVDTFDVDEGWNLIGAVGMPVPVGSITSIPPGMNTSRFYRYQGSYTIADTLSPKGAYWVRASQAGALVLSVSPGMEPSARIRTVSESGVPPAPPGALGGPAAGISDEFGLDQNYPNPFNPATTVGYRVPVAGRVTIAVYDMLGRLVATLVDGAEEPGYHEVVWKAGSNASGVYTCRMTAPGFTGTRTLILMK